MRLTKLTPTTPVPLGTFRNDMDQMFDQFFFSGDRIPALRTAEAMWSPSLDFSENEKEFVVRLEAPGVAKEDLEVNLDGQILTLSGHRVTSNEGKDEQYFWREREEGRFLRSLRLPAAVDNTKVDAKCEQGLITVRLPKTNPKVATKIPVH